MWINQIYKTELYQQLYTQFGQALSIVKCSSHVLDTIDLSTAIPVKENHKLVAYLCFEAKQLSPDAKDLLAILLESHDLSLNFNNEEFDLWQLVISQPQEKWLKKWQQTYGDKTAFVTPYYIKIKGKISKADEALYEKVRDVVYAYLEENVVFISLEKGTYLIIHTNETDSCSLSEAMMDIKRSIMTELFLDSLIYRGEEATLPYHFYEQVKLESSYLNQVKHVNFTAEIITLKELLPQLIVNQLTEDQTNKWFAKIIEVLQEEPELVHTLRIFFEESLNVSEAAKKLYIHRNSLQYRLDRFYQKTGYDIRKFKEAHIVYQALYTLGTFNKRTE